MERGDVYRVGLDPTMGREQAGERYVLVVTTANFNKYGAPVICPITQGGNFAREMGFAVSLNGVGSKIQGVILCHQMRVLDLKARGAKKIERLPSYILDEVLMKIQVLFE